MTPFLTKFREDILNPDILSIAGKETYRSQRPLINPYSHR
jgi:hypothetical protein